MSYELKFTDDALEDIESLKKSGDKYALKKLSELLTELTVHPRTGGGQPEELRFDFAGCWSRRISGKHRLVYRIVEHHKQSVVVLYAFGHYSDK